MDFIDACLNRERFPLCQLPGIFPRLGLVLNVTAGRYGPEVEVFCLATGVVERHDPAILDPVLLG